MKKVFSFFICALFVCMTFFGALNVSADNCIRITSGGCTANSGETADIQINLSDNIGIAYLRITVICDADISLVTAENGDVFEDFDTGINLVWSADNNIFSNGNLANLKFKVSEKAQSGKHEIKIICRECYNENSQDVNVLAQHAYITVPEKMPEALPIDDFEYTLSGTQLCITDYIGSSTDVIIGSSYEIKGTKYTVNEIAECAFEAKSEITSVILPATVNNIGDYAFYDCVALKNVTVYCKDANIGERAFGYYYISKKLDGLVENIVIKGYSITTVQTYAKSNNIAFKSLNIIGDFSGDGTVNSNDLTVLRKQLLSNMFENIYDECFDLNSDGKITLLDLLRLKSYLANNTVPLGK